MAEVLDVNESGARAASRAGLARDGRMPEGKKPGKRDACNSLRRLLLPRRIRGTSHVSHASRR